MTDQLLINVVEAAQTLVKYEEEGGKETIPYLYWDEHFDALKDALRVWNRGEG